VSPVRLPHHRHYAPAAKYPHGPPHTLRAVPSMIDLDLAMAEVIEESSGVASGPRERGVGVVKPRDSPSDSAREKVVTFGASEGGEFEGDEVKHYDADGV
jgi:hypothetical protein